MKKRLVGDTYSRPRIKPNICLECGSYPVVSFQQAPIGGLLLGLCEKHKNYSVVLCGNRIYASDMSETNIIKNE